MDNSETATWAIVELLGHVRMAGRLSEEERFGCKLGRIDIPTPKGFVTQHFSGASVYRVTYVDEAAARAVAMANVPEPIHRYEMPVGSALSHNTGMDNDDDYNEDNPRTQWNTEG